MGRPLLELQRRRRHGEAVSRPDFENPLRALRGREEIYVHGGPGESVYGHGQATAKRVGHLRLVQRCYQCFEFVVEACHEEGL